MLNQCGGATAMQRWVGFEAMYLRYTGATENERK
jgi:hypothetical protein